jgi:hypothetical protein
MWVTSTISSRYKNARGTLRTYVATNPMLDEAKTDRDSWREQANKITALIEDQSAKPKGFWARLRG